MSRPRLSTLIVVVDENVNFLKDERYTFSLKVRPSSIATDYTIAAERKIRAFVEGWLAFLYSRERTCVHFPRGAPYSD